MTKQLLLIETLRWEPDSGFVRFKLHVNRLTTSASKLRFPPPQHIEQRLVGTVADAAEAKRIRITLDCLGNLQVAATPFAPVAYDTIWKLAIAETRLSSTDPLLRLKTTRRDPYDAARAEFRPEDVDEVLLLNERGEPCEGTISSLFIDDGSGILLTPPVSCGLLPGILRAHLLRSRRAKVAKLHVADLSGNKVYVGNSLRGLIKAKLI